MDAIFAAPLRGKAALWPADVSDLTDLEVAKRRLFYHGIGGILTDRRELLEGWPDALLEDLHNESLARAMWELRHKPLIAEVVETLHDSNIRSVLLKGTALAYAHYVNPAQRFRGDTDLLISERDLVQTRQILAMLGWTRQGHTHGPFGDMHYQETWRYRAPTVVAHDIDLHWEVTNSRALREVLDADQVIADAIALPTLSPHAYRAEPVAALIHSAVNQAEHARSGYFSIDRFEHDPNRLLWAVDIDFLARELTLPQWDAFAGRCIAVGVASVCLDALAIAEMRIGTIVDPSVRERLRDAPRDTPATRFLKANGDLKRAVADLRAAPSWSARLRYIFSRAFPSQAHLRVKYPALAHCPIALLYVRRQFAALGRLLKGASG